MKLFAKTHTNYILIAFLVIVVMIALFYPFKTALIFYKENTNDMEAFLPLQVGDNFQIVFTHSIHLTDVVEKYQVTESLHIKQYEIIFEEFGIGMPANASEGEEFAYEDGKYHIKNMNRNFPTINIRNGKTVSKHRLLWGNRAEHMVWFNTYFEPGAWFTLKIEKLSLWQMMNGVKIHE